MDDLKKHEISDTKVPLSFTEENEHEANVIEDEEDTLNELIITDLQNDLFTNQDKKVQFEKLFEVYEKNLKFIYFRILKRCKVIFEDELNAVHAQLHLDNHLFDDQHIRIFFAQPIRIKNSRKFLEPPANEKTFLISPPSSPPVGWEQQLEDPPVVNLHLVAALAKLQPNEPCELVEVRDDAPGIILHPCADLEIDEEDINKPRKFIPTRRPVNDMS